MTEQYNEQFDAPETTEEHLTVEIPTEIQAGRSSADCYACSTLVVA